MVHAPQLQLLGRPRLAVAGGRLAEGLPDKAYVLAALLVLGPGGPTSRDELMARLWEDATRANALTNMRQLVARIRHLETSLGVALFEVSRTSIVIAEATSSDLSMLSQVGPVASAQRLDDLVALYRGDLLEGIDGLGLGLTRWINAERQRVRERFIGETLDGALRVGGQAAIRALRRLSEISRYDESVCRGLLQALFDVGDVQGTALVYNDLRSRLRDDLHIEPSAATDELFLHLMRQAPESYGRPPASARTAKAEAATAGSEPSKLRDTTGIPRLAILMPAKAPLSTVGVHATALAGALMEDVTIGLCRLRSVAMIAPHSAWQFSRANFIDAVKPFDIDYVLETQVGDDPSGGEGALRLAVKLVHTATRQIPWAEKYSLQVGDAAARYRDLTNWIIRTLGDAVEQAELVKHGALRDPGAYGLYLNGRQHMRVLDLPSLRRARKLFAAAIERAPNFSLAHSGIARTLVFEWVLRAQGNKELLEEAVRSARRAISLDPFDGDGHRELGRAALYLGDLDGSLRGFDRAEQYAPHHADMLADYADTLIHNSSTAEAKARIDAALDLNPLPPDDYRWTAGGINFFLGNYDEALAHLVRMKNLDPALKLLAACAIRAGDKPAARKYRDRALELNPDFDLESWITKLPQRDPRHRKEYSDALKAAGFH
jgi:DNA-binding SARP family transcriptional activator/Tfp pilus assembly protein PilF/TolB-like protein